jgi:hypothetical protein
VDAGESVSRQCPTEAYLKQYVEGLSGEHRVDQLAAERFVATDLILS